MVKDVAPLDGYQDPYGLLLAVLQDATDDWRMEFDWSGELKKTIGSEVMRWRPYPSGPHMAGVMLHMIVAEVAWFESFVLKREVSAADKALLMWDEIDVDAGQWPEPPDQPLSWYFDLQDQFRLRTLAAVKEWPTPDTQLQGRERIYTPPWVLGHVIQHESYHGGQIVLLYEAYKAQSAAQ